MTLLSLRRLTAAGTKITKLTKTTKRNFFFVIFVVLAIFVPPPSAVSENSYFRAGVTSANACFSDSLNGGLRMPRSVMMPLM